LESVKEYDDADEKDSKVARVRLPGCLIRQGISIDAMVFEPMVEAHVCDQNDVPSDETGDRGDIHEPRKDGAAICTDVHVCENSSERCDEDTPNG